MSAHAELIALFVWIAVIVVAGYGLGKEFGVPPLVSIVANFMIWLGLPVFAGWITGMANGITSWTQPVVAFAIWLGGFWLVDKYVTKRYL